MPIARVAAQRNLTPAESRARQKREAGVSLSCHRFPSSEVRLWLSAMAYNLGNLWRRLVAAKGIETWSLTGLRQRLAKTGGRLEQLPGSQLAIVRHSPVHYPMDE